MLARNHATPHNSQSTPANLPSPSQHLHAVAQASGVRPFKVYSAHGDFPLHKFGPAAVAPTPAKNRPGAKAMRRKEITRARPSFYMRHIWPYLGIFAPLATAIRHRKGYVVDLQRLADAEEEAPRCVDWLL